MRPKPSEAPQPDATNHPGRRERGAPKCVVAVAVALLVLPAVLAAIPSVHADGDTQGAQVTDPAGDARIYDSQTAASAARKPCVAAFTLIGSVCQPLRQLPAAGGLDAPPSLDILWAKFSDTPEEILVEFAVASLDEAFSGAAGEHDGTTYMVCWSSVGRSCDEGVVLAVSGAGPDLAMEHFYGRSFGRGVDAHGDPVG